LYGGGWRQAGGLAAACLFALDHHLPLLHKDHENARYFATELEGLGFRLERPCETNMVWTDASPLNKTAQDISMFLEPHGIRVFGGASSSIRWVLHHQISREAIDMTLDLLRQLSKQ
jgi:threonine aldolase